MLQRIPFLLTLVLVMGVLLLLLLGMTLSWSLLPLIFRRILLLPPMPRAIMMVLKRGLKPGVLPDHSILATGVGSLLFLLSFLPLSKSWGRRVALLFAAGGTSFLVRIEKRSLEGTTLCVREQAVELASP